MKRNVITATLALAMVLAASGQAWGGPIFNYSFGNSASGQITIGAAAVDPGYFLVTDLTILTFDNGGGPLSVSNVHVTRFEPQAAFNPTTGAFINHSNGRTFNDIGGIVLTGSIGNTSLIAGMGDSFQQGSNQLLILGNDNGHLARFIASGPLTIQDASAVAVPEPSSVVLLVTGCVGLGAYGWRRRAFQGA